MVTPQASKNPAVDEILKQLTPYDMETENAKAIETRKSCIECLKGICERAQKQNDWVAFGTALHFLHELSGTTAPVFYGAVKGQSACGQLHNMQASIKEAVARITKSRAEHLRDKALKPYGIPYLSRHRFLEKAIRMVWELLQSDNGWPDSVWLHREASQFIARCFLDRGRLVLPKGSSIPQKKIEALKKAWHWALKGALKAKEDDADSMKLWLEFREYILQTAKENDADIDSMKLLIEIGLELELYEKSFSPQVNELTRKIASGKLLEDPKSSADWPIIDRGRSIGCFDEKQDEALFKLDLNKKEYKELPTLPLLRAKAGHRLKRDLASAFDEASFFRVVCDAVRKLADVPFSSPIWVETIEFLAQLDPGSEIRNAASVAAWQICKLKEEDLDLGLQVRMWWSRHKMLYDLAFHAALSKDDWALAARIADSPKSRPTIKALAMESVLDGDTLKGYYELEARGVARGYDSTYHRKKKSLEKAEAKKKRASKDTQGLRPLDFEEDIPAGWAAIHLYLDQDKKGHALMRSAGSTKDGWLYKDFEISDIWQKFQAWQAADRYNPKFGGAATELHALCESLGYDDDHLGFLFNKDLPDNLIIIPHDILHLVPIHSVMKNGEILLKQKKCIYLPAWGLPRETDSASTPEGEGLFDNFEDHDPLRQYLQPVLQAWKHSSVSARNIKVPDATANDVRNYLKNTTNPEWMVFLCHGKADPVNPYNSGLLLRGSHLTHAALVELPKKMAGTKVFLGACETDMSPPKQKSVDEHLSVSTAFFQKGASEIAGGLWRVHSAIAKKMVEHISENRKKPLVDVVWEKQKDWWDNGIQYVVDGITVKVSNCFKKLYYLSSYRVVGFPRAIGENTDE